MRHALRATAFALLATLLAACSMVPTSGPIRQGPVVDSGESNQFIRVVAAPPSSGADPDEIVRGFLEANASLEQDHAIARRYLMPQAAVTWDATASTTIYDPASLAVTVRGERVRVRLTQTAELLDDGTLVHLDPPQRRSLTYGLTRVPQPAGDQPEWRISTAPDGMVISSTDLRRAYRPYWAHFLSQRVDVLVPDGRMLPVVGPSLPTALTELVLGGPAAWLAPAVRTGVPAGATLALGAVPVDNGVAQVELSQELITATDSQRRDLAAQLTWTLTQLPEVSAVRLLVAGEDFPVPGLVAPFDRTAFLAQAPDALSRGASGTRQPPSYVLDGEELVRVTGAARTALPIGADEPGALAGLAVSLDERRAASAAGDGSGVWLLALDPTTTTRRVPAVEVRDLSFDVDGSLWFVEEGRLRRLGPDGRVADVPVEGDLPPLTAARLARDGARIALVAGGLAFVAAIRTDGGLAVGAPTRTDSTVSDVAAIAWRDATSLDLVGRLGDGGGQALRLSVGSGQVQPLGTPVDPVELAAAPASVSLAAAADERILGNVGLQWRDVGPGRSVAYPG
ncbi:MAG: GerMN domain-containing protein [Candidatus Nanopelagicales bacterium]|nr:GerMN domain-containing protein [Candidatus Nanopelagicales bacterium]